MRIAIVSESFYPAVDSTTTTLKALADRLIDTGHEVVVVAPGPGLASYRGSVVVRVNQLNRPGRQVRAALVQHRPDVVHVANPGVLGRKALKHARRLGLRTVAVQHSPVPDPAWDRWRSAVADRADTLLVTAAWQRDRLGSRGVDAITWLPGVDTAAFTPAVRDRWLHEHWARSRSSQGPRVVVGYVGSLRRRHDVRRLVELADVPGIRPVVIGSGPQRDWLAARLPDAKLTGTLDSGTLSIAMASLDVLVHPGESETCCHALREASASGVPVVAPRSGGAREVVQHLETGLVYEPTDEHGLSRAVASLAADGRRGLLGEHGRRTAAERDWAQAVDELVARHYGAGLQGEGFPAVA